MKYKQYLGIIKNQVGHKVISLNKLPLGFSVESLLRWQKGKKSGR